MKLQILEEHEETWSECVPPRVDVLFDVHIFIVFDACARYLLLWNMYQVPLRDSVSARQRDVFALKLLEETR